MNRAYRMATVRFKIPDLQPFTVGGSGQGRTGDWMRRLNLLIAGPAVVTVGLLAGTAVIAAPASLSVAESSTAMANPCTVTADDSTTAGTVNGTDLSAEQMHNAQVIAAVVRARRVPDRAAQIALMTAMQESSLTVLHRGDRLGPDSRGLFQQRDSWGPENARLDPAASTGAFLDALVAVPGWQPVP